MKHVLLSFTKPNISRFAYDAMMRGLNHVTYSDSQFYLREFNEDGTTTARAQAPSRIKFDRPTVICCGGIEAIERKDYSQPGSDDNDFKPNYQEIGGVAKIIYTALGGDKIRFNPEAPQVLSFSTSALISNKFNLSMSNRFPNGWYGADAVKLAESTLSLISDDYEVKKSGVVMGKKLPMDEAQQRLSNLTLYGHSYGNSLFRQYSVIKRRHMEQLGYSDEEQKALCNAIVSIATGPVMDTISQGQDPFNSVYIISPDDTSAQRRVTDFQELVPKEQGEGKYHIQYPDDNTAVLWLSTLPILPYTYINCNAQEEQTSDAHNMRAYTAFSGQDPIRAAYFETVLMNAVMREGVISPVALLQPNSQRFAKNNERLDNSPTLPHYPTREITREYTNRAIKAIIKQARTFKEEKKQRAASGSYVELVEQKEQSFSDEHKR